MLASIHVIRLVQADLELPKLDDTFFNNCVSAIANLTRKTIHADDSPLYNTLYEHYLPLKPHGYVNVGRIPNVMGQMLVIIAQQARLNFVISLEETFSSRLKRFIMLKLKHYKIVIGTNYFGHDVDLSITRMMMRCCIDNDVVCQNIMNQYKVLREQPIPVAELNWIEGLILWVRQQLVSLPMAISKQPEIYVPFMFHILNELEVDNDREVLEGNNKEFRLFSLLPQKKVRPLNITINTTILREIHNYLNPGTFTDFDNFENTHGTDLWFWYFNLGPIVKKNKSFEEEIVTDCMSASLLVSRKKKATVNLTPRQARQAARNSFLSADRVIAVDPGRNPIISAVVYNDEANNELMAVNNTHNETLEWGRDQHYHECGFTRRNLMTNKWMKKSEVITTYNAFFNTNALTTKTGSLENYKHHAIHVLANLHSVLDFYSSKRFKRLKWKTFIRTQKSYEKIVARLKGGQENTLVVWGNAKFPSSGKGSKAVPTSTLLKKVRARVKVLEQDEFNTSKKSCCCHQDLRPMVIAGRDSYHVRICQNENCYRTVWDRNVSAAINILFLFKNYNVDLNETPEAFRRGAPVADQDLNMNMDE